MTEKRAKELNEIRTELQSIEDVLVLKALEKIERKGDSSLLPDLIDLWATTEDHPIKKRVETILFGLKDKNALQFLIDFLASDVSDDRKWLALNAIWQSGLDASGHLNELIDFAIFNSFTNAIDVMTIIENSEFSDDIEATVDANIKKLNTKIATSKSDVTPILIEISSILIDKKIEG